MRRRKNALTAAMLAVSMALAGPAAMMPAPAVMADNLSDTFEVVVSSGYLALRTAQAFDSSNEIGKLYTGDQVIVQNYGGGTYWYVYAPSLSLYGYVNSSYLRPLGYYDEGDGDAYYYYQATVHVDSGYLALRTARAYDSRNEIGKLYTGDTVEIIDASYADYWYVYAPTLGRSGYVNKDYLNVVSTGTYYYYDTMTVKVQSGYLALRTARAYDSKNEIGKLYTGDPVQVLDTAYSDYWYVYAPTLNLSGYVNKDYLTGGYSYDGTSWTVRVQSGYLALRTAKAYDYSNEIGKLYTGDTVKAITTDGTYWYVYAPSLGLYGYVNSDYLY